MEITGWKTEEDLKDYSGNTVIWGDNAEIVITPDEEIPLNSDTSEKAFVIAEKAAAFVDASKENVIKALLEDDFLSIAADWASSAEEAEDEERECYIMEDGSKVFIPVTEEDFAKSLHLDAADVYIDPDFGYESITLYISCRPDYFAGHVIQAELYTDGTVEDATLAG